MSELAAAVLARAALLLALVAAALADAAALLAADVADAASVLIVANSLTLVCSADTRLDSWVLRVFSAFTLALSACEAVVLNSLQAFFTAVNQSVQVLRPPADSVAPNQSDHACLVAANQVFHKALTPVVAFSNHAAQALVRSVSA